MKAGSVPTRASRPAAGLVATFLRCGYVRRFAPVLRKQLGQRYKKGYEVRLLLASQEQVREVRRWLEEVGLRPGRPFRKHRRLVQPVYGKAALDWFLARLPRGRARAAAGFAAGGARSVRRSPRPREDGP